LASCIGRLSHEGRFTGLTGFVRIWHEMESRTNDDAGTYRLHGVFGTAVCLAYRDLAGVDNVAGGVVITARLDVDRGRKSIEFAKGLE
jgi:hypothetical protein